MTLQPSNYTPQPSVELHIEELVLHGFAPSGRERLGDAVQQELTRLLNEHGLPSVLSSGREIDRLNGGTFQHTAQAKPETTGHQVARAVFGGMSR